MTRWYSGSLRMLAHSAHCCKRVRGCRGLKAARYAPAWACWGCGCPCLQCVFILLCDGRGGRLPNEQIPDAAYQPFLFLRPGCPQQPPYYLRFTQFAGIRELRGGQSLRGLLQGREQLLRRFLLLFFRKSHSVPPSSPIGAGLGVFVLRRGGGARVTKKASTALAATRLALNAVS